MSAEEDRQKEVTDLFREVLSGSGTVDMPQVAAASAEIASAEALGWGTLEGKVHRMMAKTILGPASLRITDL